MDRTSIRILSWLTTALRVIVAAFAAFLAVGVVTGAGPSDLSVHARVAAERLELAERVEQADVVVRVDDPSASQVRWSSARDLAPVVVVLVILWLVRRLLRSSADGEPFTGRNVLLLRILAAVIAVGVPLATYLQSVFAAELADSAGLESTGAAVSTAGIYGGLVIFVLAEIFAVGVRMRDDLEGTV